MSIPVDEARRLARAAQQAGQLSEAVRYWHAVAQASQVREDWLQYIEVLIDLGIARQQQGALPEAEAAFRQALVLVPDVALLHSNLGNVLREQGRLDEALAAYQRAVELEPGSSEWLANLGVALEEKGLADEASAIYRRAVDCDPGCIKALNNLATLLWRRDAQSDALLLLEQALRVQPGQVECWRNRGHVLKNLGRLDEAIEAYQRAQQLSPDHPGIAGDLLFALNYHPDWTPERIFAAYRDYDRRFGLPSRTHWRAHQNVRQADRRLRVGYVSGAFYRHSSRHFLMPLLAGHDHSRFEIFLYSEVRSEDAWTGEYRRHADVYVCTAGMDGAVLAERIRADAIDILVDLTGHAARNRLDVFARKPAPVSVHWLDFGYTTGLSAIDYYFGDEVVTPPGCEALFAEKIWRLATPALVYRPDSDMGEVGPLPAGERGYITFGTLTRHIRINHRVIRVWSEILKRVPDSRLIIDSGNFRDAAVGEELAGKFAAHGVAPHRLEIGYHSPPWDVLRSVDIALDCFPHNCGTTLIEGLYLGVPFVTLADRPSVGRLGASILTGLGHPEWIALSEEEYIDVAVALAGDESHLSSLRETLRREMQSSRLMDEEGFTRGIEAAYDAIWTAWCAGQNTALMPRKSVLDQLISLFNAGCFAEVEGMARQWLERDPAFGLAWKILAAALQLQGKEALEALQRAAQLLPDDAEAHSNLGDALRVRGRSDLALLSCRRALEIKPDFAEAYNNLANALQTLGQMDEAELAYRRALELRPGNPEGLNNLGSLLATLGRLEEAMSCYRVSLSLKPDYAAAHCNLGCALQDNGQLVEAAAAFRQALALNPVNAKALSNLGNVLTELGDPEGATQCHAQAVALCPDDPELRSNQLFALNYHPDKSEQEILEAYRACDERFGAPHRLKWRQYSRLPDPVRRLKVGYVSPDFRKHSCRYFLEPLLANHDKIQFEIHAYAELAREDEITLRYKSYVDQWVATRGMSDDALAERIRADGIDILVDLAGHTNNNRLPVFARKPAPISLSWLGFGYTTGLGAIDYLLTDQTSAPVGSDAKFTETPWRLATPGYAYRPAEDMGEVGTLPALERGYITFGTLTRAVRINHRTIRVWSEILKRVEGAQLVIDSRDFHSTAMQDNLAGRFAAHGIDRERLQIGYHSPPWDILRNLDIGLDCFPHNSGTTLFETLYMGVPFVTLAGRPSVGLLGASVLTGLGHSEWITFSEEEYINLAVSLATDIPRLAMLRAGLRREMCASALMDEKGFARKVEQAYRQMFIRWAEKLAIDSRPETERRISELVVQAVRHHQTGDLDEAERMYRQILTLDPCQADSLHLLGVVAGQRGRHDDAVRLISRAIEIQGETPTFRFNLGRAYRDLGCQEEAVASFEAALALKPDYVDAHSGLGDILLEAGRLDAAATYYERALAGNSRLPDVLCNLGNIYRVKGWLEKAQRCYEQALSFKPDFSAALSNLGVLCWMRGDAEMATQLFQQALALAPNDPEILCNLGQACHDQGRFQQAIACYEQALAQRPNFLEALANLGNTLGVVGELDRAIGSYVQALAVDPVRERVFSNLLFALNYHPQQGAEEIRAAYREFDRRFGLPLQQYWRDHQNNKQICRRIKVGYVSPDYRRHSSRYFLAPLLERHDRRLFEVYAYAELTTEDSATIRYRAYVDHWIPTLGLDDNQLAERIRADGIDILVDLAGHTEKNRLLVFARKPAPVSVSWLGYGYTTGLSAIDYYLGDEVVTPLGSEALFAERVWRLPVPALVYRPDEEMGKAGALPAMLNGHVTFGTLTRMIRINPRTIEVWAQILKQVQGSRLIVDSGNFRDEWLRESLAARFAKYGIERDRLEIGCHSPPWDVLRSMDIALDCFPHNSGTTLIEGLYMGVPFVTLSGRPSVGTLGASILTALGHSEWIAHSEAEYIELAVAMAADLPRLAGLRASLRRELLASPLCDEAGFARQVETAFRQMFEGWVLGTAERLASENLADMLAVALAAFRQGKPATAEQACRQVLAVDAMHAEAWHLLGLAQYRLGDSWAAQVSVGKAIELAPQTAMYHANLGAILSGCARVADAIAACREAVRLAPGDIDTLYRLGQLLRQNGEPGEAVGCFRAALEVRPEFADAAFALGNALRESGCLGEALAAWWKAVAIRPEHGASWTNLGNAYVEFGALGEAIACYEQVLKHDPGSVDAWCNLGVALQDQGRLDEAAGCFRRALQSDPACAGAFDNLLYTLNYHPDLSAADLYAVYEEYNRAFGGVSATATPSHHGNDRKVNRPLRVGYVSGALTRHSSRHFLQPLLERHDRQGFIIHAYSDAELGDEVTDWYRRHVHVFVETGTLSDTQLADRIRSDGIDILVDLAGHTRGNRLGVFALKPAPVSLHWLDFGYTTGLKAIDYYLGDNWVTPPGCEPLFSEKPWRLERLALAYRPDPAMGETGDSPARRNGYLTFGSLTRRVRINHRVIASWAEILRRVPGSRLVIDSASFRDAGLCESLREQFESQGIDGARLILGHHSPPWDVLRTIDIVLDCFPHNSGTTLIEGLYMGVPFVTLQGRPSVGTLGASILCALGRPEWVATSEGDYIDRAVRMAHDRESLAAIRAGLRGELQASPLMDELDFVHCVESAYRQMFAKWASSTD